MIDTTHTPSKKKLLLELAKTCKTSKNLLAKVENVQIPKGLFVCFQVLMSTLDIKNLLSSSAETSNKLSLNYSNTDFSVFSLTREIGTKQIFNLRGDFAVIQSEKKGIYLIISIASSVFWKDGVLWRFGRLIPKVAFLFLRQDEMKQLFSLLYSNISGAEIRFTKIVSKGRIQAEGARKRDGTGIEWTDLPLNDAFLKAEEENRWFKAVDFELITKSTERIFSPVVGRISKYGSIMCEKGVNFITPTILPRLLQIAQEKFKLLLNRSREKDPQHRAKPLAIEYATDVLKDKESFTSLIQTIRKYSNSSCALFHGNPYIHMSLADYTDGSSYDIWVVNPKRIMIIPQIRATEGSLSRLVNHIFEHFKEGAIIEGVGLGE